MADPKNDAAADPKDGAAIQRRPTPLVPARQRRHVGRTVADVHGRRHDALLAAPQAGLRRLATWLTPAFYIDLGRPCNSACLYCAVPPHEDAQGFTPLAQVPEIIAAGAAVGCDRAILIGGEPTIHPQLDAVLELLAEQGLARDHIVMTNGLKLADPAALERLVVGGVGTLHVSIDTVDSAVYDRISRSQGRLAQQLAGLDAALARTAVQVYVYTAVTRLNVHGLDDLLDSLVARAERLGLASPPPWILAVVKPIGDALRHADSVLLDPPLAADLLRPVVARAASLGLTIGVRNVQACLAPDLVPWNVDYYLDDFSVEVATGDRVAYSHGEYWYKPAGCAGCGHDAHCTGVYREVERRFGVAAFKALGPVGLRSAS